MVTSWQLYHLFVNIFLDNTNSSKYRTSFSSDHFPVIFVCHSPGFDYTGLEKHGYSGGREFLMGNTVFKDFKGWIGNNSETLVQHLVEDVSILSSEKQCPLIGMLQGKFFIKVKRNKPNRWSVD